MSNTQEMNEDFEKIIISIVSYSGEAKGYAYEALTLSEEGKFDEAEAMMEQCNVSVRKAHSVQTDLIRQEISGEKIVVSMIMVHAQDHLMTTLSERELIRKMIEQNHRLYRLEQALLNK
ncbi:PTS lactose/cellobiose transporter subunit IIA [Vibrio sp. 404]|uniref:PTS lactose/cellobiose transporter subunit IIA n=1 Tax=Vibrio marinisediminis TaxID=2758441 RepID=A0A7W2ITD3_9VIBR|nr:PTS lactose/cellobiose transporter subunit IIA [Vibrio marinisediminis]MBA5761947.1 PTS lactose/cellobiose transporter subunit IIA [Vibrio marinisediminis]